MLRWYKMVENMKCYLRCVRSSHDDVFLPDKVPVFIGRTKELQITDRTCSRNQLQLTANYSKRYVLVKRLGANLSHIDGMDIPRKQSCQLKSNQTLYVVEMKFPHDIVFIGSDNERDVKPKSETAGNEPEKLRTFDDTNESSKCLSINQSKRTLLQRKLSEKGECKKSRLETKEDKSNNDDASDSPYAFDSPATGSNVSLSMSSSRFAMKGHWSQGLKASMTDPKSIIFQDNLIVVIKDKYPKARIHWLVLPLEEIAHAGQLKPNHVDLLKHMLKVAKSLAKDSNKKKKYTFRYGYHAVASMSQLHMHVISQDFSSSSLKTKKHWNSFTTDYFVDAETYVIELRNNGKIEDRKAFTKFLKEPLRCHKCNASQKNMPTLKTHIEKCET
ncbi:aprataxin-like [Clavelina lepadiformis]|uniref:aprataxin-like n=1 Tax=Clavelina lepadiformis TaxID=159417 RepID=UPI004041D81E